MRGRGPKRLVSAVVAAALLLGLPAVAAASPGRHAKTYRAEVQAINREYAAAVNRAKATLTLDLSTARTAGERSTARAQYTLAIVEATQTRDQELVALGPPPARSGTQRDNLAVGVRVRLGA
jgi:hypothetical protein